mgnify:CR=1 FL=1
MAGSFVARKTATRASAGAGLAAATNLAEMLRVASEPFQWGLEGKVYIAGHGLEEAATDGIITTLDDTTPTFMLMAPASGTIVVPIWAEFRLMTEGGAAPDAYLSYVGVDRSSPPSYTSLDKLQINGSATSSLAICGKTITAVTTFTSAQNVLLARRAQMLDNGISVEGATTVVGQENMGRNTLALEFDFWSKFHGALQLYAGRSVMFHTVTGTTVSAYGVTFMWAELESSIYDHIA